MMNVCANEMAPFGSFVAFIKGKRCGITFDSGLNGD